MMRRGWKIVVRCVCFAMILFLFLAFRVERGMLALVDGEAPYYIWNREKSNSTQGKHYRVIVLGDSVANASYLPEALSKDTINLSLGGTSPLENYYTLRDWLDHNETPDACYITFGDGHLRSAECFWSRTMFSHRYSLRQDIEMLRAAISYQEPTILENEYRDDFIYSQLYLPRNYITSIWNGNFYKTYEANEGAVRSVELHGGRYIARGVSEYIGGNTRVFDEFSVKPMFDDYLRKIIELCIENGITPRILKMSVPEDGQYTDNYERMFHEYFDNLLNDYPMLTVDWLAQVESSKYFVDGAHMNSHGALHFCTELKKLHPEDFSTTEMDENQIAAIDDSIRAENKIEWILKWIDGKDYTVLFYDKRGEFKGLYEDQLKGEWDTDDLRLEKVSIKDPLKNEEEGDVADAKAELTTKKPEVWEVLGIGESTSTASNSISITLAENSLMLQLEDREPQAWTTASDDMLGVAVVNNYTNSVVCMKSFRYVDEAFLLAQ